MDEKAWPPWSPTPTSTSESDASCPVPTAFTAPGAVSADTAAELVGLFVDALTQGVFFGADRRRPEDLSAWTRSQLPRAAVVAPDLFGPQAPHRTIAVASLRAAIDFGYEARVAFEVARDRGLPDRCAPADYQGATLPPQPAWLDTQCRILLTGLAHNCALEGLVGIDTNEVLDAPDATPRERHNVIDDDGVHRIRSSWIRDDVTGKLYQLIVARQGQTLTILRRVCGVPGAGTPIAGSLTLKEMEFVEHAIRQIRAASADPLV